MKTLKEQVRMILNKPEKYVPAMLYKIRIIDKRLCKSLICKLSDKKQLLHFYRIPFWCKVYKESVVEEMLAAILEISFKQEEKRNEVIYEDDEYLLAEEYFRKGKYEEARDCIIKAAKKGDQRAIDLMGLLKKTQKNSFNI